MSLIGLALMGGLAAAFALLCRAGLSRATLIYAAVAWIPLPGLIAVQGRQTTASLHPVEVLATVLALTWWWDRRRRGGPMLRPTFNRPLIGLVAVAGISLVTGRLWLDPEVPAANVNLAVSLGQIALFVWPIAIAIVVGDVVRDARTRRRLEAILTALALPGVAYPVLEPLGISTAWSVHIGLVAGPFAFARLVSRPWTGWAMVDLAVVSAPIVAGLVAHKALWYIAGGAGLLAVLVIRGRAVVFVTGLLVAALVVCASYAITADPLPPPARAQVEFERAQQSLGPQAGRLRLAIDAVRIWERAPVFGVGPGNMWPYMHRYSVLDTSHNQYTNLLLELGLAGLTCFVMFAGAAVATGFRLYNRLGSGAARATALGWLGGFIGLLVGGLTGDVLLPSIRNDGLEALRWAYAPWVALGLLVSLARVDRGAPDAP